MSNASKSKVTISELASLVQKESLCFGCASALYGLTKHIYEIEIKSFEESILKKRKELYEKLSENKRIILDSTASIDIKQKAISQFIQATDNLEKLGTEPNNIKPKFFFVNFYGFDIEGYNFNGNARLFEYQDIYWIPLGNEIKKILFEKDPEDWTKIQIEAKCEQRYQTAHEMAHEVFRYFDASLDTEENAKVFAKELINKRKYYVDGFPGVPKYKITYDVLEEQALSWLSTYVGQDVAIKISQELPFWLESIINQSEAGIIQFLADAD